MTTLTPDVDAPETIQVGLETLVLTKDQQEAMNAFNRFLCDPHERVFVLSGYSGCGKTTLVRALLDRLPEFQRAAGLIQPEYQNLYPILTATTNKAAENLAFISGTQVHTIHSWLGLIVKTDYKTGETTLRQRNGISIPEKVLLFVDEASYVDTQLLQYIFSSVHDSKIVFIGDPAQLTPVKSHSTPVFNANFPGAALTTVVRQAEDNPIIDLATKFRHAVNTGEFFQFKPDGQTIQHLSNAEFTQAIEDEFTRDDWRYRDSKILAWTNKRVIAFNNYVRNRVKGNPEFVAGDYAVCNSYFSAKSAKQTVIKTDQMVEISDISQEHEELGVKGRSFILDGRVEAFMPNSIEDRNRALKKAQSEGNYNTVRIIKDHWIDLRAAYACTINKSQGSTFDRVFIDLDDVSRCNSGNQIARMLYVAVSRARYQVFLTGDLA